MALGEITKQLAQHAIGSFTDSDKAEKAPAAAPVENVSATVLSQVQAMQRPLKDDEELLVRVFSGAEWIRIMEIFVPSPQVLVLSGVDSDKNLTRVIAAAQSVQLVCKVVKSAPGLAASRIRFVVPKPKAE
jgi:hypothetical protein